uniref:Uncharacterized protein n=1 Tax=Solanum tuberosum TaxID=4113 RepID=M1DWL6_SOLTU
MSTHSTRESECVKANVVLHAASGRSRGTHLKQGRSGKVVEKCRLESKRSSRHIAKEVSDPYPDRCWTQDNFTLESVKVGKPRKLLANRRPSRRSRSNPPFGPPHQLRIL